MLVLHQVNYLRVAVLIIIIVGHLKLGMAFLVKQLCSLKMWSGSMYTPVISYQLVERMEHLMFFWEKQRCFHQIFCWIMRSLYTELFRNLGSL